MLEQISLKFLNNYIYIILAIVVLLIMIIAFKKKVNILEKLKLDEFASREILNIGLIFTGLIFICIALLGPQKLDGLVESSDEKLDIYVLIDTSKSMLVEDVIPNRLEKEKSIISNIIENLDGDRIGFIPFSSSSYVQMPLTDDYNLANMFLDVVDTDMIGGGGSDVGQAISLAQKSFAEASLGDKVILIISDGEENDNDSEKILESIKDDSLKVYTMGIGTQEGGLIPIYNTETGDLSGYKQDQEGNHVVSKLNDDTLKELAIIGDGKYYMDDINGGQVDLFISDISKLEKSDGQVEQIERYSQLYQIFLAIGIVVFLLGYFLPVGRHK